MQGPTQDPAPYAEALFRFMIEAMERNLKMMREQQAEKPEDEGEQC